MSTDNLLFLHGALYDSSTFGPIIERLTERIAPHAFDFPGHGSSPFPDDEFSIPLFAESTIREMDSLGIERTSIFGYSMGGYIGLWLARHHPGRIERVMTLGTKMEWNPDGAAREINMLDPEMIDIKVPQFGATLRARHGEGRWVEVLQRTALMMESLGGSPALPSEDLQQIETPVRIMVGDRDRMVTIEETVEAYRRLPHGELAVLPDTGHPLENVQVPKLVSAIEGFC
jgi:pimeloyl-ACP methyl ester carboxylesterase